LSDLIVHSRELAKGRDINLNLMNITLFRPVGLYELSLIWDQGMRGFPPRLPQQPIFYPVANIAYASQIARDWNTRDEKAGFSGFVTTFQLEPAYLPKFDPHTVGFLKLGNTVRSMLAVRFQPIEKLYS
jgi:hypothetical protein